MEASKQQLSSPIWQNLPVELLLNVFDHLIKMSLDQIETDPFYPWVLRQVHRHVKHRIDREYRRVLFPRLFVINQFRNYSQRRNTVESITGVPNPRHALWKPYIDEQASKSFSTWDDGDRVTFYTLPDSPLERRFECNQHLRSGNRPVWERPRVPYVDVCLLLKRRTLAVTLEGATAFRDTSMETSVDRVAVRFNAVQLIDALLTEWERRSRRMGAVHWLPSEGWLEGSQDEVSQCYFKY
ncbi:hypothetical protein B0H65DRAFT_74098 [Neurospora tetraspora]|uniref:Uncharacterized protein n=1 Tax=Neurospora tetraspora TaxID=94610 RepID=A0AAE0J0A2_9PEZI|nr:hypothetical protein B0H65DRAFT_74098 [Neurospora tetraspora]